MSNEIESDKQKYSATYLLQTANDLQNNGLYELSITYYNELLERDPNDYVIIRSKAYSLFKLKLFLEAIECYNKLIELRPEESEGYNNKASILTLLKRNKEAIECYNESIRLAPLDSQILNNQGYNYFLLGKYKRATIYYLQALKINPKEYTTYTNLSTAYRMLNEYDKMIELSTKSIQLFPQKVNAYYHLATAYYYTQNYHFAIESCEKLSLNAQKKDYQSNINANMIKAKSYLCLSRFKEAIKAFEVMKFHVLERNGEADQQRAEMISFWISSLKLILEVKQNDEKRPLYISFAAQSIDPY